MKMVLLRLGMFVFVSVFMLSGVKLLGWYIESQQSQDEFEQISEMLKVQIPFDQTSDLKKEKETEILIEYQSVYEKNPDFSGWISIEDTKIDYPVMQTKDEPDFYLKHNFEKENSSHGVPYIQADCDLLTSDNLIIYGHHMKDGTMFSELCMYEDREFYDSHKTFRFDTKYSYGTYEIVAVFKTTATEDGFSYYQFVNAGNEKEFSEYINTCKELSLYGIRASAVYGDRLITLSTCEYTHKDGRLVIVAKRI